jgi:thymidylate kinase
MSSATISGSNSFITDTFTALNNSDVKYCSWKSNSHLRESFESRSDFDLLIAYEDTTKFLEILSNFNFKKKFSSANYVYPGLEDYLGFDELSGRIYHFHIHYKLIIGKKYQKNFRIPLEKLVLEKSILHNKYPIKVIIPEMELIFLIIRSLLKFNLDLRTIKRVILKKSYFPQNILTEFRYLRDQINIEVFNYYCRKKFANLFWLFKSFSSKYPEDKSVIWLFTRRYRLLRVLKVFQIYRGSQLSLQRKVRILASKNNMSWLNKGGLSIGFVGVDGAGKSTTIAELKAWLFNKLSVKTFYMGLPKGNFFWEFLRLFFRIFIKFRVNLLSDRFNILKNLYSAIFKYRTYSISEMKKNQGNIVLFDRYPLQKLENLDEPIDGPLIKDNPFWAKIEKNYYRKIRPADYLFVLLPDYKDAINRKNEHNSTYKRNQIEKMNQAIVKLLDSNSNCLIPVKSSRNREEVLLEIKQNIWRILN